MNSKPYIRITKEFKFEMAHALPGYDGLCKNIHGHSYELMVTVAGRPITDRTDPKYGMVMDFGDLKKIVRDEIVDKFDHSLVLRSDYSPDLIEKLEENYDRIILLDYQPTSEYMIADFANKIKGKLPPQIELKYLMLRETVTSYAEWYAEDNPDVVK
ncbi:MAG: 6-carboxytetrahydropterin synthase QueD [Marinilabiliales bacterium]|nr:MAG: 6-carboxytetrahydropterin synthase QueD [Marinilabiliales bacterium]